MALFQFRRKKSPTPEEHTSALRDSIQAKLANYVPDSPVEDIVVAECDPCEIEMHMHQFVMTAVIIAWADKATFPKFAEDACLGDFTFGIESLTLSVEIIEELNFLRTLCIKQFATHHVTGSPWGKTTDAKHFAKQVF